MKHFVYIIFILSSLWVRNALGQNINLPIDPWSNLCGDELENLPKKIKTFGNAVYIAGSKTIGGSLMLLCPNSI